MPTALSSLATASIAARLPEVPWRKMASGMGQGWPAAGVHPPANLPGPGTAMSTGMGSGVGATLVGSLNAPVAKLMLLSVTMVDSTMAPMELLGTVAGVSTA